MQRFWRAFLPTSVVGFLVAAAVKELTISGAREPAATAAGAMALGAVALAWHRQVVRRP